MIIRTKLKTDILKCSLLLAFILAVSNLTVLAGTYFAPSWLSHSVGNSLALVNGSGETSITLSWTAPGDDGNIGTAAYYDIRYSTSEITLSNWHNAVQVSGMTLPQPVGSAEQLTVSGLTEGVSYYFAVRTRDEAQNWSDISNIAYLDGTIPNNGDSIPPDPITNLIASTGNNSGEIMLNWSATGDDGLSGIASNYEIRYSLSVITEVNWYNATIYNGSPTPVTSGTPMSFTLSGLTPGVLFYFAIKARDDNSNYSDISNVTSAISMYDLVTETDGFLLGPAYGSTVANSRPRLIIANVSVDTGNIYYFQLADEAAFSAILADDSLEQDPGQTTAWKTPIRLNSNQTYYWRVKPNADDFSDYSFFTVSPLTHVYPNPFDIDSNDMAVFAEIPENSNLIIMTISGTTVKQWTNIIGGEAYWDGTNESGNTVASGTYLWFVEDSELSGKIVVRH